MKRFRLYQATDTGLLEDYWQLMIQDKFISKIVIYIGSVFKEDSSWELYDQDYAMDDDYFIIHAVNRDELRLVKSFDTIEGAKQFILEHYFEKFL